MSFDYFGLSFLSDIGRESLARKTFVSGQLKKYKYKRNIWLSLGRDVTDPSYLVNEYAYLDYEWKYDKEQEELIQSLQGTKIEDV
jgi:hypothetical protein